ncbi:Ankyrin repeat-containing protein [Nonomuraea solani]|uniref:Ankyrin repeat-containing protein n=1 Tax=Nonomuraea solani TaxID=1144553 RepID=A0A1H6BTX0_9ACTN|nr:ankyrin repeat domain-containing protein [Nonomuraea solani]SEG63887.1 Ankyrin repeat-containing protein [Nonomuraea solani]
MHDDEMPLHDAAGRGSLDEIVELAASVKDVDAEAEGRTALWVAVYEGHHDVARALVEAGADPWRPMMGGWSPGRLSLAGPEPGLFDRPAEVDGLTDDEAEVVAEARRLTTALGARYFDGMGMACVAGIDAAEAARRLEITAEDVDPEEFLDEIDPFDEKNLNLVGLTDVPGGCVVAQPWGPMPQTAGVLKPLAEGTTCYGLYVNPRSGNEGSSVRDGEIAGWDLTPGAADTPQEILSAFLYRDNAVARACAAAGLRLAEARAITGPPDVWARLPERLVEPG